MNEARPHPASPIEFEGVVEHLTNGSLLGWAAYTAADSLACPVEVVGPAGLYTRTTADLYRADLDAAGKRRGLCAFNALLKVEGESVDVHAVAVLVAGLPHRLRLGGGGTTAPVPGWADTSEDPLAQDLVVHRCHFALTGTAAPAALLSRVRPALPLTPGGVCATLEAVAGAVKTRSRERTPGAFAEIVNGLHRGLLQRPAEPSRLQADCEALRQGTTIADLASGLVRTAEFLATQRFQPVAADGSNEMARVADVLERATLTLAIAAVQEKRAAPALPAGPKRRA